MTKPLRVCQRSEKYAVRRTVKKAARYGGAERACEVRAELPISLMMVGKKTGKELKATLEQKNIAYRKQSAQINISICRSYSCEIALGINKSRLDFAPVQASFPGFPPCIFLTKSHLGNLLLPPSQVSSRLRIVWYVQEYQNRDDDTRKAFHQKQQAPIGDRNTVSYLSDHWIMIMVSVLPIWGE